MGIDIAAVLATVKAGFETAQALQKLDRSLSEAEIKKQVLDVSNALLEARQGLLEFKTELAERDETIRQMRATIAKRDNETVVYRGYRFLKGPNGQAHGLPFCPRCEEVDGRLLRVSLTPVGEHPQCPHCKAGFGDAPILLWQQDPAP